VFFLKKYKLNFQNKINPLYLPQQLLLRAVQYARVHTTYSQADGVWKLVNNSPRISNILSFTVCQDASQWEVGHAFLGCLLPRMGGGSCALGGR
jgi:hypothetical protein